MKLPLLDRVKWNSSFVKSRAKPFVLLREYGDFLWSVCCFYCYCLLCICGPLTRKTKNTNQCTHPHTHAHTLLSKLLLSELHFCVASLILNFGWAKDLNEDLWYYLLDVYLQWMYFFFYFATIAHLRSLVYKQFQGLWQENRGTQKKCVEFGVCFNGFTPRSYYYRFQSPSHRWLVNDP